MYPYWLLYLELPLVTASESVKVQHNIAQQNSWPDPVKATLNITQLAHDTRLIDTTASYINRSKICNGATLLAAGRYSYAHVELVRYNLHTELYIAKIWFSD